MDPNENLKRQLAISKEIQAIYDDCNGDGTLTSGQREAVCEAAERLASLVHSLDEWLAKGGFLPKRWTARAK